MKESKEHLRHTIWDTLLKKRVARPPLPPHGRIPNFEGAERAAELLTRLSEWRNAKVIKVNPDSPQRWVRLRALNEDKILLMPTPRIREGFILLDPNLIPSRLYGLASTIRGAFKLGVKLRTINEIIRRVERVDFIVEGSVVVNIYGERLGKGEGYGELEYAILLTLKLIDPDIKIATTVHNLQVLRDRIPQDPYDVPIDYIVTPSRIIRVENRGERPKGLIWSLLSEDKIHSIPLLKDILRLRSEA
ncbi:MAG: 5-formyltetrahydrofolate cyclo-ligase [Acidilobaceae archaeon]